MPIISDQQQVAQTFSDLFQSKIVITSLNTAYEIKAPENVLDKLFKIVSQSHDLKYVVDPTDHRFTQKDSDVDVKFSKSDFLFQKVFMSSKAVSYVKNFIDTKIKMYQSDKYREYLLSLGGNSKLKEKDFQHEILKIATSVDMQNIVDTEVTKFVPKVKIDDEYSNEKQVAQNLSDLFQSQIEVISVKYAYEIKALDTTLDKLFNIVVLSSNLKYSVDLNESEFVKNDSSCDAKFLKLNSLFKKVLMSSKAVSYIQNFIDEKVKIYQSEKYREYLLSVGDNGKLAEKDFQNEILKLATSVDQHGMISAEFKKFKPKPKIEEEYFALKPKPIEKHFVHLEIVEEHFGQQLKSLNLNPEIEDITTEITDPAAEESK